MRNWKRILVGLLATVLVVSGMCVMAEGGEMIVLTTCKSISDTEQTFIDKKEDVLTDNIWFRDYRELFNLDVQYDWTAPGAQYDEKMNAQIAANDLPDFMTVNATQLKQLVDYGMAYDLTDVFEEYASDFVKEMMAADNFVGLSQATFDGKLYALPNVGGNRDGSSLWWIRKDWLDNLGLEIPTTLDELVNVMYAFAQQDPDQNGENDTYGMALIKDLFGGNIGLTALAEGMGAYMDGWIETDAGKEYGSIQPQAKSVLELLAKLYADNVLDREFIVKDGTKVAEEIVAGKFGLFSGQHFQAFYPLPNSKNADNNADWIAISIVSGDGSVPKTMLNGSASSFCAVNVDCKHPEKVVEIYNYYYQKDCAVSPDYDIRYHGHLDDDPNSEITEYYRWSPVLSFYPMQNMYIHMGVEKHYEENDDSEMGNGWISSSVEIIDKYYAGDLSGYAQTIWCGPGDFSGEGRIHWYDQNDMFLINAYIGANTDSMTLYKATLDQLRLETFTSIITGDSSIDAFDSYVEQWKALGGDAITQELNVQ